MKEIKPENSRIHPEVAAALTALQDLCITHNTRLFAVVETTADIGEPVDGNLVGVLSSREFIERAVISSVDKAYRRAMQDEDPEAFAQLEAEEAEGALAEQEAEDEQVDAISFDELHPDIAEKATELYDACKEKGVVVYGVMGVDMGRSYKCKNLVADCDPDFVVSVVLPQLDKWNTGFIDMYFTSTRFGDTPRDEVQLVPGEF